MCRNAHPQFLEPLSFLQLSRRVKSLRETSQVALPRDWAYGSQPYKEVPHLPRSDYRILSEKSVVLERGWPGDKVYPFHPGWRGRGKEGGWQVFRCLDLIIKLDYPAAKQNEKSIRSGNGFDKAIWVDLEGKNSGPPHQPGRPAALPEGDHVRDRFSPSTRAA